MRRLPLGIGLLAGFALWGTGCQNVTKPAAQSPLRPLRMSPDSCVLEVFKVYFPHEDPDGDGSLWNEIDEQQVSAEVRQRLSANGFRAGVVAGQIPPALARRMELAGKPPPAAQINTLRLTDVEAEAAVWRSRFTIRSGHRREIPCSAVYEQFPLLVCEPRGVSGESLAEAQGVLVVQPLLERDGRVRLQVAPEVQYGKYQTRWTRSSQGIERGMPSRLKRTLEPMTIQTTLSGGEMLVIGSRAELPGSLGHRFLTRDVDGRLEEALIVIRLAQTQHEDLFDPQQPLPLDMVADFREGK